MPAENLVAGKSDSLSVFLKWAPVLIVLYTALIYGRAVFNGFTSFDDNSYIVENLLIRDLSLHGIKDIFSSFTVGNYHPFTLLTYSIEYALFGLDPLPYHLTNVLLHLVNTWLVFRLAGQLSGNRITATVVSLLFAIHPMHVESVAWVSERKDVLYSFFYLLSLLYYLRYLDTDFRAKFYVGALLLFVCSLFSKSAAVTLPVLLIGIDLYKERKISRRSLVEKVPFFLLSVLFGILNIISQHADKAFTNLSQTYNIFNRIVLVASSLSFYIFKAVVPVGLSAMHFFPRLHNHMLPGSYYTALPFIIVIVILLVLAYRTALRKEIFFGFAFFLITISVMLQIVAVGSMLTAERYTYLPYIGLFYIVGQWFSKLDLNKLRRVLIGAGSMVLVILSIQTWARIGTWKNDTTLYTDIREKDPKVSKDMAYGFSLRADSEKATGDFSAAIRDYDQAMLLNPEFYEALCNRGYVYMSRGDLPAALNDFNLAISLHPEFADAYNNRGGIFYAQHDPQSAILDFNKAIEINPTYVDAYTNRGWTYFGLNNTKAALDDYTKAITINPRNASAYISRGWIYFSTHDTRSAMADYDKAIQLNPKIAEAYYNRALGYFGQGDVQSAIEDFTKAIAINPRFTNAYNNRAWAYVQDNNNTAAIADYTKAISIDPQDALAFQNMAAIKANTGDLNGALKDYDSFLKLQPGDNVAYHERALVRFNLKDTAGACADWKQAQQLGNTSAIPELNQFCH